MASSGKEVRLFIDTGVNLAAKVFKGREKKVIKDAVASGVVCLLATGTNLDSSSKSLSLCRAHEGPGTLLCTVGIHPHDASSFNSHALTELAEMVRDHCVVAIGETGLDYNRMFSPKEAQLQSFRAHVELACLSGMPLFLHERDSHKDFVAVLREFGDRLPPAVVHCFTGTAAQAKEYIKMGLHIGVTGTICMPRRGRQIREALAEIPLERLMVETDAPWMHPDSEGPSDASGSSASSGGGRGRGRGRGRGGKGKGGKGRLVSLPEHVKRVAATLAETKGVEIGEVASVLASTTSEFFRLPPISDLRERQCFRQSEPALAGTDLVILAAERLRESGVLREGDSLGGEKRKKEAGTGGIAGPATAATPPGEAASGAGAESGAVPTGSAAAGGGGGGSSSRGSARTTAACPAEKPATSDGKAGSTEPTAGASATAAPSAAAGKAGSAGGKAKTGVVDTHVHLDEVLQRLKISPPYADLAPSKHFGPRYEACIAQFCDPGAFAPSLAVYPDQLKLSHVYGAFGCHPHHAKYYDSRLEERILGALEHPKAVALGETGLDYGKMRSPAAKQREAFARQATLAASLGKTLVVHCGQAETDTLKILTENVEKEQKIHLHCYTGGEEDARKFAKSLPNLYFGLTGWITFGSGRAVATRKALRSGAIPLDRLVLETDGPHMRPEVLDADMLAEEAKADEGGGRGGRGAGAAAGGGGGGGGGGGSGGGRGRGAGRGRGGRGRGGERGGRGRGGRGRGRGGKGKGRRGRGGGVAHPGHAADVGRAVADILGLDVEIVLEAVRRNTKDLYGI